MFFSNPLPAELLGASHLVSVSQAQLHDAKQAYAHLRVPCVAGNLPSGLLASCYPKNLIIAHSLPAEYSDFAVIVYISLLLRL